jgi:cell division protein FtsB
MFPPFTKAMINKKNRQAQFDIAAHKKEIDRLLRENAKLKAKNLTLERELLLRPPFRLPPERGILSVEAINKYMERLPSKRAAGGKNAA